MNTQFKSTAEAAARLAGKPEIAQSVERDIRNSGVVTMLVRMRLNKGKTQEEVAACMKCDSSKISRMESGNDFQLRLIDIIGYAKALGVQVSVLFDDSTLPHSARIKQCVFQIDHLLKELLQLAREQDGNEEYTGKINQFYQEVLINFLKKYFESHEKLQMYIPLKAPADQIEDCDHAHVPNPSEKSHSNA